LVREAGADERGLQVRLVAAAQRLAVAMGAVAASRAEQLTQAGDGDRTGDRAFVVCGGDGDAPAGKPVEEVRRAVDGVDEPTDA